MSLGFVFGWFWLGLVGFDWFWLVLVSFGWFGGGDFGWFAVSVWCFGTCSGSFCFLGSCFSYTLVDFG